MAQRIITLLFVLLATGASAATTNHIYWTEWRSYNQTDSRIVQANADGTEVVTVLDGFNGGVGIKDLAIDNQGQKIYFANRTDGLIERSNFDGTDRESVVTDISPVGLALDIDGSKIYWADYTYSNPRIRRANLDGTVIEDLASASNGCVLEGIVLDITAGHIYWAERMDQQIWRANMAGGSAYMILQCWEGIGHPCGLAIAGGRLYWGGDNAISSSNLNGDNVQSVVTDLPDSPRSMEVDTEAGQLYWTTSSLSSGYVQRINLNGTGLTTLASGIYASYGLALEKGSAVPVNEVPEIKLQLENYPNPFNPQTTLVFHLPSEMVVSLGVYDISGRLMEVLLNRERALAGRNEVLWQGKDLLGHMASSGSYYYRLETETGCETKSMTLIK